MSYINLITLLAIHKCENSSSPLHTRISNWFESENGLRAITRKITELNYIDRYALESLRDRACERAVDAVGVTEDPDLRGLPIMLAFLLTCYDIANEEERASMLELARACLGAGQEFVSESTTRH